MTKKKNEELEQLQNKVNELEAQLKRAVADYRNLESRISQGRSELTSFVGAELVRKLLPVLDHLEQALAGVKESSGSQSQSGPARNALACEAGGPARNALACEAGGPALSEQGESEGWFKGVELAVREFKGILQSEGLAEIEMGPDFDPSLHEAVDTGEGESNKILKVVRKGFKLNGKVIRPAQVVVGREEENI